jgi:hypothetical protein
MKIRRIEIDGIGTNGPGRNAEGATERDGQMREVPALNQPPNCPDTTHA